MLSIDCIVSATRPRRVRVVLDPKDDAGNAAPLQAGSVTAGLTTGDAGAGEVLADQRTLLFRPAGAVVGTSSTFTFGGDADLGEGTEAVEDTITIAWTAERATNLHATAVVEDDV